MEIERDVEYTKTKLSFINAYMAYALHDRDVKLEGFNEGKEAGQAQAKLEAARNFLKYGDSVEKVAACTGLPLEQVQALASELQSAE